MAALTCDKDELLAAFPCVKCLSEHQLIAALVLILCKIVGQSERANCDPAYLLSGSACLTCLSEKQMLEAIVALFAQAGIDAGVMEAETDLREDIACLMCLTPRQLMAIIINKLCEGIADGTIVCAPVQ